MKKITECILTFTDVTNNLIKVKYHFFNHSVRIFLIMRFCATNKAMLKFWPRDCRSTSITSKKTNIRGIFINSSYAISSWQIESKPVNTFSRSVVNRLAFFFCVTFCFFPRLGLPRLSMVTFRQATAIFGPYKVKKSYYMNTV